MSVVGDRNLKILDNGEMILYENDNVISELKFKDKDKECSVNYKYLLN